MTPWLLIAVPLAAAATTFAVRGAPRTRRWMPPVGLALTAGVALWVAATQATSEVSWGPIFSLTLSITGFGRAMVVVVPLVALPIVAYAATTEKERPATLLALMTAFVGAMEMLVASADLLTLLIAWELVGALSWILIAHERADAGNARRAAHAFLATRSGDLGLYVAAAAAFAATGTFAYSALGRAGPGELQVIAAGVLLAAVAKSAQLPFSPWLFSAMAGPTPVSALLHSSTMVAAGAYLLIRLGPTFGAVDWFAPVVIAIGLGGAVAGGATALTQRHPKLLLAGSTTAQYGLMFVAVGVGSPFAAGAQLVVHAGFKSLLFLGAGSAMRASRTDDLAGMRLGRRLPVMSLLIGTGVLALAAVPPLGGAWSKEQIAAAAFEWASPVGWVVLLAGFLSAAYAARYWLLAYGPGGREPAPSLHAMEVTSVALLAAASLGLGVLWIPGASDSFGALIGGTTSEIHFFEVVVSLAAVAAGVAAVTLAHRGGHLVDMHLPEDVRRAAASWFGLPVAARSLVVDPVLSLSRLLAAWDDRVIDAGVRAAARVPGAFSALLSRRAEISLDTVVNGVAAATMGAAARARIADDRGVDVAAEGTARGIGGAGERSRRLQTGLSHHYYVVVAAGFVVATVALAVTRS